MGFPDRRTSNRACVRGARGTIGIGREKPRRRTSHHHWLKHEIPDRSAADGLGYVEGVTRSYCRHGTSTLFAALSVLHGSVIALLQVAPSALGVLGCFLNHLDRKVPVDFELQLIVDIYANPQTAQGEGLARAASALPHP